jgi:aspartyl-tRNA(Asn)/glutamyl-tRNA(Gln) amidotransferase subunit A
MRESAVEVAAAVRGGQRKAVDVLDEALAAIADGNEALGAFVHVDEGLARAAAEAVDAAVAAGRDPGPFAGVPIGVKDLEDCAGMPTGHGSLPFAGRGPVAADSIHVARLRAAGAVPVGKTAAPEFGTLNFTKTKVAPVARNPWDPERTPGGSSGGSAAAVAAGWLPAATASDGGGSTRIPADPVTGPDRVRDRGQGPAHHHRGRQRPPPGRDRRARRPRPLLAAPPAGVL